MRAPTGKGQRFIDRTPLAAVLVDRAGLLLAANEQAHELFGLAPPGLLGSNGLDLVHPDDRARVAAALAARSTGDQPASMLVQARWLHQSGRWLDLRTAWVDLLAEDGFGAILVTLVPADPDANGPQRSRGWFEAVVSGTDDIVQVADADGRFLWASGPVETLLGMPTEATIGLTIVQVGNPERPDLTKLWFAQLLERPGSHPPVIGERRLVDGTPVHLEVRATNLLDDPEVGAIVLQTRDVTDRVAAERAQAAIDRTETRWRTLSEHTHELVALLDEHAVLEWAGPGFQTLLGYDPESLVGRSIRHLLHPDDRRRPGGLESLVPRTGGRFSRQYRFRHADGSWRIFDVDVTDLRHEPAVAAFIGTAHDVTDRVAAEEANRRLATAMESAGAAVVLADLDRRVVSWNRAAERLSGQPASEVLGRRLIGGDAPEVSTERARWFAQLAAGETVTFETDRLLKDGRRLPLSITASPVLDGNGTLTGYSYIAFDISQRKVAEADRAARAAQAAVVAELGQRALAGASLQELLDDACTLVADTIRTPHVHVLLASRDGRYHQLSAATGLFHPQVGRRDPVEPEGWVQSLGPDRRASVVEDFQADDAVRRPAAFAGTDIRSGVLCAIDGDDGAIGYFAVLDDDARAYPAAEVDFLQSIANVLAMAVNRTRIADEMHRRALHDALTGLPNRALLLDRLTQAVGRLERREGAVGILFIDLDRFKRVNDTLGHTSGDEVLVETARRLLDAVRAGDTVARTGGDEFLVLAEDLDEPNGAVILAERIARSITAPMAVDSHPLHVTASIGVAVTTAAVDPETLIRDADIAMYRAKQEGRDRVQVFDGSMRDDVLTRMAMEESLRAAVAGDGLEVVFQPQVRLDDGKVVGIEALARWEHGRLGSVAPHAFIALAEEIGLLDEITSTVLHAAAAATAAGRRVVPDLRAAVNLTPSQIGRSGVLPLVDAALEAHGLPPGSLVIELTETAALDDDAAPKVLATLRERGLRVSIDDFGTGYSSLARLTRLPLDEVKIDRSFVNGVVEDQGCAAVVSATVTLARELGLRLVAEGVETDDQRRRLLELGCTYGQGWLFSGPLEAGALPAWLEAHA